MVVSVFLVFSARKFGEDYLVDQISWNYSLLSRRVQLFLLGILPPVGLQHRETLLIFKKNYILGCGSKSFLTRPTKNTDMSPEYGVFPFTKLGTSTISKDNDILPRKVTYPLNNAGSTIIFLFWNSAFSGEILIFGRLFFMTLWPYCCFLVGTSGVCFFWYATCQSETAFGLLDQNMPKVGSCYQDMFGTMWFCQ